MQQSQGASDGAASVAGVLAQRYFGYDRLREGQQTAIDAACAGRDVLVVLPTGAGKSLCYQLPAMWHRQNGRGPTLVISPLIALMDDQVQALAKRGIAASALHSQRSAASQRQTWASLRAGTLDILYASPERALMPSFLQALARFGIAVLAVDEAHCISVWGHDFRPEYARLMRLRQVLDVPVMALTATATARTQEAIVQSLGMRKHVNVQGHLRRPNLRFAVRVIPKAQARLDHLGHVLQTCGLGRDATLGRTIVYCATRARVDQVVTALTQRGLAVAAYHAGHPDKYRRAAQQDFMSGVAPVVVATNAFGMGIDQADVRMVVHMQAPASIEAYYQEAGRAGRDGAMAQCLLLCGEGDWVVQRRLQTSQRAATVMRDRAQAQALAAMQRYVGLRACRQQYMIDYFTQTDRATPLAPWRCGVCDACGDPDALASVPTAAVVAQLPAQALDQIVRAVGALRRPTGKIALAQALRGSRAKAALATGLTAAQGAGSLHAHPQADLAAAIEGLIETGRLERRGRKYPKVWLAGRAVRQADAALRASGKSSKRKKSAASPLRRALENYVRRTARHLGWRKPYMVMTRQVMLQIEQQRPVTLEALEALRGIGPAKIERFGVELLALIRDHL